MGARFIELYLQLADTSAQNAPINEGITILAKKNNKLGYYNA
jgi:hypothetical protein